MEKYTINVDDRQRRKKRQQRRIKRLIIRTTVYVVAGVASLFILKAVMNAVDHTEDEDTKNAVSTDIKDGDGTTDKAGAGDVGKDDAADLTVEEKRKKIKDHPELYTQELTELAERNEEALDFILAYPEEKDNAPATSIGTLAKGTIPLLIQWDERWGYAPYGESTIAVSGCGPTALSMVVSGLTGDNTITPYKVAKYSEENGYYAGDEGTSWSLMADAGDEYEVQSTEIPLVENNMIDELESGHPIICSVKQGDFTEGGHFIVLTGMKDGKFKINDPNSRIRSAKLWSFEDLSWQIDNLWVFKKKE